MKNTMAAAEPKSKFVPDPVKRSYIYTTGRAFVGLLLLLLTFQSPTPSDYLPALILVILMIASVEMSIVIEERTRVTLGTGALLAAILLFPAPVAALAAAAGFAPGILFRPAFNMDHRLKMCFSAAGYAILIAYSGAYAYSALGGTVPLTGVDGVVLTRILVVFLALNLAQGLLLLPSLYLRGAKWREYLNVEFPTITMVNLFGVPIGILLAWLSTNLSPWAMLLAGVPLGGAMYLVNRLSDARDNLRQRIKELNILHEVSREVTRLIKVEQLSDMLHVESRKIIASPGFRIALADESSDELLIILDVVEGRKRSGFYESPADTFEEYVMQSGEPLRINEWPEEAEVRALHCREEPWVRSYLGVPLIFEDKILGVIGVRSNQSFAYSDNHLEILRHFANNTAVTIENSRLYKEVQDSFMGTIEALIKIIDAKDPYTRYHSIRVADLSTEIARLMDLPEEDVEQVRLAALLHDIGKVGLPEAVLCKKGDLDDTERALVQQHPERGVELIRGIRKLSEVLPSIERHHERMDGNGYPRGITGNHIPITARIIAVADAFDAIISERPYRRPLPVADAVREIRRCSGSQFDPAVVEAFEKIHAAGYVRELYEP